MVDWDNLRIFLEAVRAGNYTHAAKRLRIDRTTVGRRLERLERDLGAPLFEQGDDGYHPTPAGRRALQAADEITRIMDAMVEDMEALRTPERRELRLAISAELGAEFMPQIARFLESSNRVKVSVRSTPDPADSVIQRKCDVALVLSDAPPDHVRARKIGRLRQAGYATAAYLDRAGRGLKPNDYDWIRFSGWTQAPAMRRWDRMFNDSIQAVAHVDTWQALRGAVEAGIGAGFMWTFAAEADPRFIEIAPADDALGVDLWTAVRDDVPADPSITQLLRFLETELSFPA